MITLTDASKKTLERALARAEEEQLTIKAGEVTLEGGSFYVFSKGKTYFTNIVPKGNEVYESDCNCKAGRPEIEYQLPLICKHVSLSLVEFKAFEAREKAGVRTLCECGNTIEAGAECCENCIEMMNEVTLGIYEERQEHPQRHYTASYYGPFSAKNPPRCKYCGLPALEEGEGKTCTARYEGYYAHPACEVKARKQVA